MSDESCLWCGATPGDCDCGEAMMIGEWFRSHGLTLGKLLALKELAANLPEPPWYVDSGTMADKMTGCWLIRPANRHDFPTWILATSGRKDAKEIAEFLCLMRNAIGTKTSNNL